MQKSQQISRFSRVWRRVFLVLDSKAGNVIVVAGLFWAIYHYDMHLFLEGGTLYLDGYGFNLSLIVAATWIYAILFD